MIPVWLVLALMFVAGLLYNELVEYVQAQLPRAHGVTAWLVVGGVGIALVGLLLLTDLRTFVLALLVFVACGSPMIWGSMRRYWRERGL